MHLSNDFISVPVPANRVHEVYALLAKPPVGVGEGQAKPLATGGDADWDEKLVRRLYNESADNMKQMLKVLAQANGKEVSTNEIATALGLKGASSVAGMAGAVGRRVASRYRITSGMPWVTRWQYIDPSDPRKGTETLLALPEWICDIIRDL